MAVNRIAMGRIMASALASPMGSMPVAAAVGDEIAAPTSARSDNAQTKANGFLEVFLVFLFCFCMVPLTQVTRCVDDASGVSSIVKLVTADLGGCLPTVRRSQGILRA